MQPVSFPGTARPVEALPPPRRRPGTHEWSRFITPEELVLLLEGVPGGGLRLEQAAGMEYNPLTGGWALGRDLGINYIAHFSKAGGGAAGERRQGEPPGGGGGGGGLP